MWQGNKKNIQLDSRQVCIFQCWVKREIDIETEEKSSHLVDSENDMSCDIKIEIDNAEEESVNNGESVEYWFLSFFLSLI